MHKWVVKGISKIIKHKYFCSCSPFNQIILKPPWKILFFGSDEFSVASLNALCNEYRKGDLLNNLEVATSLKNRKNPVEKYALKERLVQHNWPINPEECKHFHIGLVVSFGHLIPEDIINSFPLGMLNVHASLLPRWRGAAPIIYAIANGDEKTGITIMKIKPNKFDIGEIVAQADVEIPCHARMPELHVTLADLGAQILIETLREMPKCLNHAVPQPNYGVTLAPKVNSSLAHLNWNKMSARCIYNLGRALTGVFDLTTTFNEIPVKLYNITECNSENLGTNGDTKIIPGRITYNKESKTLKIQCADGKWINVEKIGMPRKKVMSAADFNNGFISKQMLELRVFR